MTPVGRSENITSHCFLPCFLFAGQIHCSARVTRVTLCTLDCPISNILTTITNLFSATLTIIAIVGSGSPADRISKTSLAKLRSMSYIRRQAVSAMARGKEKHICWHFTSNRTHTRFVEFETGADLKTAVDNLDGKQFKDAVIHCTSDVSVRGVVPLEICKSADEARASDPRRSSLRQELSPKKSTTRPLRTSRL